MSTPNATRSVVVDRELPHPPEKVWRALTQPPLIENWLMKNDFKPVVGPRFPVFGRTGGLSTVRFMAVEPNTTLSYSWACLRSRKCRHLDSHSYEHGDPPAHGAVGLPAGSGAGLPGRQRRVEAVLRGKLEQVVAKLE